MQEKRAFRWISGAHGISFYIKTACPLSVSSCSHSRRENNDLSGDLQEIKDPVVSEKRPALPSGSHASQKPDTLFHEISLPFWTL
jgi:hypothetical protein